MNTFNSIISSAKDSIKNTIGNIVDNSIDEIGKTYNPDSIKKSVDNYLNIEHGSGYSEYGSNYSEYGSNYSEYGSGYTEYGSEYTGGNTEGNTGGNTEGNTEYPVIPGRERVNSITTSSLRNSIAGNFSVNKDQFVNKLDFGSGISTPSSSTISNRISQFDRIDRIDERDIDDGLIKPIEINSPSKLERFYGINKPNTFNYGTNSNTPNYGTNSNTPNSNTPNSNTPNSNNFNNPNYTHRPRFIIDHAISSFYEDELKYNFGFFKTFNRDFELPDDQKIILNEMIHYSPNNIHFIGSKPNLIMLNISWFIIVFYIISLIISFIILIFTTSSSLVTLLSSFLSSIFLVCFSYYLNSLVLDNKHFNFITYTVNYNGIQKTVNRDTILKYLIYRKRLEQTNRLNGQINSGMSSFGPLYYFK